MKYVPRHNFEKKSQELQKFGAGRRISLTHNPVRVT
jgi:hypothetical protein